MKEAAVTDALSGFVTGINTVVYTAFLHYYLAMSISKILKHLNIHGMLLSSGSLVGS